MICALLPRLRSVTILATAAIVALTIVLSSCGERTSAIEVREATESEEPTFEFTIPAGAGLAFDTGQPLEILPARLDAQIGDTIVIVNKDDRGHLVGPWFVGGGETLRQTFLSAGEFIGECTVHPSGQIRVIIS